MDQLTYRVIIEPDGKEFHAYVPALVGCHTYAKTLILAKKNVQEAMELYLESLVANGKKIPKDESFETFQTVFFSRELKPVGRSRSKAYAKNAIN